MQGRSVHYKTKEESYYGSGKCGDDVVAVFGDPSFVLPHRPDNAVEEVTDHSAYPDYQDPPIQAVEYEGI